MPLSPLRQLIKLHRMIKTFRLFLFLAISLVLLGGLALLVLPWRSALEGQLKHMLVEAGVQHVDFSLTGFNLHGLVLENINIGQSAPLSIHKLTAAYNLSQKQLSTVTLDGLILEAKQESGTWTIAGLKSLPTQNASISAPLALPTTTADIKNIPLAQLAVTNSKIHIATTAFDALVPFRFGWQRDMAPQLTYHGTGLRLQQQAFSVMTGDADLALTLDSAQQQWQGPWQVKDIALSGLDQPIPLLNAAGTVLVSDHRLEVNGTFKSDDGTYRVDVAYTLPLSTQAAPAPSLIIRNLALPWNGGTIAMTDMAIPLQNKQPINVTLRLQDIPIDILLQQLTGKQASATGVVTGTLPLSILPDGTVAIKAGVLKALQPGKISLSPEAIPGDNDQIALLRDVLKNLHYNLLALDVDSDPQKKLGVTLRLEGMNPDVYGGKPVKLNVHLSGDVLDLIKTNLLLFNPLNLIKQAPHAP